MTSVILLSRPAGRSLAVPFVFLLLMALIPGSTWTTDPLDFDLPDGSGHFYRQANGRGGADDTGYAITNDDGIPFWDEFRRLGGVQALGYPVSHRFVWEGFVVQAMQKVVFQWRPETGSVAFVNVLDRMHDLGHDDWLLVFRQTPEPFDTPRRMLTCLGTRYCSAIGPSWIQTRQSRHATGATRHHWTTLDCR